MEKSDANRGGIALLEGEKEVTEICQGPHSLLLTNRRIIQSSGKGRRSKAAVAFLQDAVTARVAYTGPNRALLVVGIVLALAGLAWLLYSGFQDGFDQARTLSGLAGVALGLILIIAYLSSGSAAVVVRTANDEIGVQLGRKASTYAYSFVNRCLELKHAVVNQG